MTEGIPTETGIYRDVDGDLWLVDRLVGGGLPHYRLYHHEGEYVRESTLLGDSLPWSRVGALELETGITGEDHNRVRSLLAPRFATASERVEVVVLRELAIDLAAQVWLIVPEGRNRNLALTHLEDALMRSVRGIFAPEPYQ